MRKLKDSGIEWIGELPVDWETRKIKYVATLNGRIGWQGLTSNEYCDDGAYLITGINFNNGQIDWSTCVHVSIERWKEAPQIQIQNGDLLITKDGTVGKVAIVSDMPSETSLNSGVLLIRTVDICYKKYLFWILQSEIFWKWFTKINAGNSTILHLYQYDFCNFSFPFPEYGIQCRIAQYLDNKCSQIDAIIARQQEVIEKLKAYKLSVIYEAVTKGLDPNVPMKDSGVEWIGKIPEHWEFRKIKNCCDVVDCKNRTPEMIPDGDYIVVRTTCIKDGTFSYDGSYRTDKKNFEEWTVKGRPQHGDIFFTREAPMGEACLVPDDNNLCMGQRVMFFRPIHGEDPRFILYSIYGPLAREYIESKNKGSTVGHLKLGQVASLPLLYCTPEEQKKISNYLDEKCKAINELISCKQEVVDRLLQYKKSLIYEVVTGKKEV